MFYQIEIIKTRLNLKNYQKEILNKTQNKRYPSYIISSKNIIRGTSKNICLRDAV